MPKFMSRARQSNSTDLLGATALSITPIFAVFYVLLILPFLGGDGKETYRAISKQLATEYATMLNSVAIQTGRTPSIGDGETTAIYDLAPTFPSAPSAGPPSAASVPGTAAGAPASVGPYSTAPTAPAPSNAVPQFADPPSLR